MPATATAAQRRKKSSSARRDDEAPIIPILARKVREALGVPSPYESTSD